MLQHVFPAMGTQVELLLDARDETAGARALREGEAEVRRLEGLLSRFRSDSELSRLNARGGLDAGPDLVRVTELALAARERTGGRFDPTVHDAVVAAGYCVTFAQLAPDGDDGLRTGGQCGGDVQVGADGHIALEPGTKLDLGGIAKGDAAERVCDMLAPQGPCLANVGGDLAVRGTPARGSWAVGLATPNGSLTLELAGGGLATSGRDRRRWRRRGEERHHVIDPSTGRPAETDLVRVTAVAPDAVEAEVAATALLLAGAERAHAEAEETCVPCVLVTEDDEVLVAGGLA
jgi:thiamine biosynthesis lipoprotein